MDYSKMTQEDFDRVLLEIVGQMTPAQILVIPGVYEIVSEELNNDVLCAWEVEQEAEEDESGQDANRAGV